MDKKASTLPESVQIELLKLSVWVVLKGSIQLSNQFDDMFQDFAYLHARILAREGGIVVDSRTVSNPNTSLETLVRLSYPDYAATAKSFMLQYDIPIPPSN
jgi:hypothetical protein